MGETESLLALLSPDEAYITRIGFHPVERVEWFLMREGWAGILTPDNVRLVLIFTA